MDEERDLNNRLWRVERLQTDIFARLDKIDERLERVIQRQDERRWKFEEFEGRMLNQEKRSTSSSLLGDSAIVKTIFYGLLAMVGALATGQFLNLVGILK